HPSQRRRVALDKVEKVVRRDTEQSCVSLVLRNLDAKDRSSIHPAKGLEIAAVIQNRDVLANANFSGFRHRRIHHFLCELRRDAVFLHHVSHLNPPERHTYCAIAYGSSWSTFLRMPRPDRISWSYHRRR